MTPFTPEQQRLARLLQLVEREDVHLQAVRGRPALERACRFTEHMHADFVLIQRYALTHLGVTPAPPE